MPTVLLVLLTMLSVPSALTAQARVGATAGAFVYAGATDGPDPTVRPHGSYAWGGAVSYQRGAWLARLGVARSEPGVMVGDDVTQIVDRSVLGLLVIEPAIARRLVTTGPGATLWLEAGPSIHRWSPVDQDARTRWGGTAAVVWRQPATRRADLSVRAHAAASSSPFIQADLPSALKPSTAWRWGVTLELAWRL